MKTLEITVCISISVPDDSEVSHTEISGASDGRLGLAFLSPQLRPVEFKYTGHETIDVEEIQSP